jgi:hypothetical protein
MSYTASVTLTGASGPSYALDVYVSGPTRWPFMTTVTPDTDPWPASLTFTSALPDPIVASPYGGTIAFNLYRVGDVQQPLATASTALAPCPGFAWPTAECLDGGEWKLVHPGNDQVFYVSIGYGGEGGTVTLLKAGAHSDDPNARFGELLVSGYDATGVSDDYRDSTLVTKYGCTEPDPEPTPTPTATPTATATLTATPDASVVPITPPSVAPVPTVVAAPPLSKVSLLRSTAKVGRNGRVAVRLSCAAKRCTARLKLSYRTKRKAVVVATKRVALKTGKKTVKVKLSKAALRKLKKAKVKKLNVKLARA